VQLYHIVEIISFLRNRELYIIRLFLTDSLTWSQCWIRTFVMVTFDTGTNFPAVSWNPLLAVAMMNIRHRWNGIGVPTQSHPNAASLTLSAWNISLSVLYIATCRNCSPDLWSFKGCYSLNRISLSTYQFTNLYNYSITNHKPQATSKCFPGNNCGSDKTIVRPLQIITYFVQQSSWATSRFSCSQEIPHIS
jgi:hypothetical protein